MKDTEGFVPDMKDISWSTPHVKGFAMLRVQSKRISHLPPEEQVALISQALKG